jgi:hypothetical protein
MAAFALPLPVHLTQHSKRLITARQ